VEFSAAGVDIATFFTKGDAFAENHDLDSPIA
jgi:hypothetical protein